LKNEKGRCDKKREKERVDEKGRKNEKRKGSKASSTK
jgi:hypothetical protein